MWHRQSPNEGLRLPKFRKRHSLRWVKLGVGVAQHSVGRPAPEASFHHGPRDSLGPASGGLRQQRGLTTGPPPAEVSEEAGPRDTNHISRCICPGATTRVVEGRIVGRPYRPFPRTKPARTKQHFVGRGMPNGLATIGPGRRPGCPGKATGIKCWSRSMSRRVKARPALASCSAQADQGRPQPVPAGAALDPSRWSNPFHRFG